MMGLSNIRNFLFKTAVNVHKVGPLINGVSYNSWLVENPSTPQIHPWFFFGQFVRALFFTQSITIMTGPTFQWCVFFFQKQLHDRKIHPSFPRPRFPVKKIQAINGLDLIPGLLHSIKNWMGPYQRTLKEVARAIRFSGLGVRSVGPVGDFLDSLLTNLSTYFTFHWLSTHCSFAIWHRKQIWHRMLCYEQVRDLDPIPCKSRVYDIYP